MDKSREAMLAQMGDHLQKPKGGDGPLEPTDKWMGKRYGDKGASWWEKGARGAGSNYSGCIVNIAFALLLIGELVIWIKVALVWRVSSQPGFFIGILLPLILPSLILPLLAILHSLTQGRLSYSSSMMLIPPPSPLLLHIYILYRKLQGEEHHRLSLAARGACMAQALVTSLPLLLLSMVTLVKGTVGEEQVDMAMLHSHLYEHSLQGVAATISLANLLIATLRYNERLTGRAVSLLVGIPFLFTNISVRLLGFSLLLAYFDTPWVLLFLGLHFCVAAFAVQLGSGQTVCGRVCRAALGVPGKERGPCSIVQGLLLSLANIVVPAGYNRDRRLGHCMGRSWCVVIISWIGGFLLHGLVINQTIIGEIPNVYTGLAPVDMSMLMPKTGLAVNLPNALGGGFNMKVVLPRTKMTMDAEHPASYELTTSAHQDLLIALAVPMLLALLTLPFTLLRVILLGWNCSLARQKEWDGSDADSSEESVEERVSGKVRNCLTVMCGVSAMMLFTIILMVVVAVYVLLIIQSTSSPLVRDLS